MPRRRARGNVDFSRLRTLRGNLRVGVGNTDMWNEISTMTPLGYRASFLAYFKFPASFASYMYGVSPALMSQNNYKEDIERGMSRLNDYSLSDVQTSMAWKALAKMYYDNTANPNRDVPSRIRRQEGVSAATIAAFKNFVDYLASTASDGVTQDAASVADAPLAQTMPVEDVSVSIDGDGNNVSADEEVIAEMSAGMDGEEGEEEVVTSDTIDTGASGLPANIVLMEGVFALYGSYFTRSHSLNSRSAFISSLGSDASTRNAAQAILTLEMLGFSSRAIAEVLYTFSTRNLRLRSVNAANKTDYGAYIVLDLVGNPRARAYQSAVSQDIMRVMAGEGLGVALVQQFSRIAARARPALQTFRFSGMRRGAVVGVQVLSMNYRNGQTYELSTSQGNSLLREQKRRAQIVVNTFELAGLESPTDATSSTDTQITGPPATDSSLQFYLIGYQHFMPTQTFRARTSLRTQGGLLGESLSYVFYFATLDRDERISGWYRSVFGQARLDVSAFEVSSTTSITSLKNAWNDSGNLDERGVLKVSPVPQSDVSNLRQALQQVVVFGADINLEHSPITSVSTFYPTRGSSNAHYSDRYNNVPFIDINRRSNRVLSALRRNLGENEIFLGANTQASGGRSDEAALASSSSFLTEFDMKAVSKRPFKDLTFGWELEGYIKKRRRSINALLNSNNPAGALKFGSGETMPVNGGSYKTVADSSINHPDSRRGEINRKDDGYEDYDVAELVSPVLEGEKGLVLVDKSVQALNSSGFRVNSSAGLHVHFDAMGRGSSPKFKAWQLANMMINYHVLHPVIDKYQNVGRTGGTVSWAKDFSESQLNALRAFSDSKSDDYLKLYKEIYNGDSQVSSWTVGASYEHYHGSRYRTVNIHSAVSRAGTVEFRQGSPSTDYDYIKNWILWLYYIVKASEVGYLEKPSSEYRGMVYLEQVWRYTEWLLPDDVASFIANSTYMIDGANIESATRAMARANRR